MTTKASTQWMAVLFSILLVVKDLRVAADSCHAIEQFGSLICKSEAECHVIPRENDEVREKRVIFTALLIASMLASLGSLAFDISLQIEGCAALYPSITKKSDEIERIRSKLVKLGDVIEDEYTKSRNLLVYIKRSNQLNRNIWLHVYRIMDLTREILEDLDPRLLNKLIEKSHTLKNEYFSRNRTLSGLDLDAVSTKYKGVFSSVQSAIQGLSPIVGEAGIIGISKGLNWYKKYKVTKTIKSQLHLVTNAGAKSRAILGVQNVNSFAQSTVTAQTKALATTAKLGNLFKVLGGVMNAASIGMEIYATVLKIKACEDVSKKVKLAFDKIQPQEAIFMKTLNDIKNHHSTLKSQYSKVKSQVTSDQFFEYLSNLTSLATSGHNTASLVNTANVVKSFESNIKKADFAQTVELQEKLLEVLRTTTYKFSCYQNQVRIITYVSRRCGDGYGSMEMVYQQALYHFRVVNDCTAATGEKYTTFAKTKLYVEPQLQSRNLSTDCLLNNKNLFELTCILNAKGWDYAYIAKETGLSTNQVDYNIRVKPCPPQPLSPRDKRFICLFKKNSSLEDMKHAYPKYDQRQVEETYNAC